MINSSAWLLILTAILVLLKITKVISCSWWVTLSPIILFVMVLWFFYGVIGMFINNKTND
jgi:hypothetical protein